MRSYIALALVMCAAWRMVEGAAYFGMLQNDIRLYGPDGNVRVVTTPYCEWEGKKMMIGSSWKTTGCEECSCSEAGLYCRSSGVYMVPPHCLVVTNEHCQTEIMDSDDPFTPCGAN